MPAIKLQLYRFCQEYIKNKETEIKNIIEGAREAANNETKSSAGDKYETGREVMQQEIDLNLTRLNEISKLRQTLQRISPDQKLETAQPGALVATTNGNYYIAISAGQAKLEGANYYVISVASPIGALLIGKKAGDEFIMNGKKITISTVE